LRPDCSAKDFVTIKQQEAGIIPFGSRFPLASFSGIAQGFCTRAAASLQGPGQEIEGVARFVSGCDSPDCGEQQDLGRRPPGHLLRQG
jgi:hypothetical protein